MKHLGTLFLLAAIALAPAALAEDPSTPTNGEALSERPFEFQNKVLRIANPKFIQDGPKLYRAELAYYPRTVILVMNDEQVAKHRKANTHIIYCKIDGISDDQVTLVAGGNAYRFGMGGAPEFYWK